MTTLRFIKKANLLVISALISLALGISSISHAASSDHGSSGHNSGSHGSSDSHGGGHDSGSDSSHDDDSHDSDSHDDSSHGSGGKKGGGRKGYGAGGHGHNHDAAGDISNTTINRVLRGRRPVWAREGIPEVELGRLNVSRAPGFVLYRAESKALDEFKTDMVTLYNMTAEQAAKILMENYRETPRIDSPVQNLALYKDIMVFEKTQLEGVKPASTLDLAAIFLGSASDKNIPVSKNTVIAVNRILGLIEPSADDLTILATKAELVRQSILTGHGDIKH